MNTVGPNGTGIEIKTKFPALGAPHRLSTLFQVMRYDPESYSMMLQYVRDGAFDWIAAEALGVHPDTLGTWIKKGRLEIEELLRQREEEENPPEHMEVSQYGRFYLDLRRAKAQARLKKEVDLGNKSPEMWLRCGPGRTEPNLPGWTEDTRVVKLEGQGLEPPDDVEDYSRAPTDAETLGKAFVVMEEMGFIQRTEKGEKLFGKPIKQVEGKFESEPGDNGKE